MKNNNNVTYYTIQKHVKNNQTGEDFYQECDDLAEFPGVFSEHECELYTNGPCWETFRKAGTLDQHIAERIRKRLRTDTIEKLSDPTIIDFYIVKHQRMIDVVFDFQDLKNLSDMVYITVKYKRNNLLFDKNGWVQINDLVENMQDTFRNFNQATFDQIIQISPNNRYNYDATNRRIKINELAESE